MSFTRTFVFLMSCCVSLSALADDFPYRAYVTNDNVYVRSGPGSQYYPTSKLQRGQEIEVYRHDPGGWLAIRPPKESFSWISGRYLQVDPNRIGVVTGNRVVARVGSNFSDIRDVIQVQLGKGEEVEVLGEKAFGSGIGTQIWYKIGPPAGEFRWIMGKLVSSDPLPPIEKHPDSRENLLLRKVEDRPASKRLPEADRPERTVSYEEEVPADDKYQPRTSSHYDSSPYQDDRYQTEERYERNPRSEASREDGPRHARFDRYDDDPQHDAELTGHQPSFARRTASRSTRPSYAENQGEVTRVFSAQDQDEQLDEMFADLSAMVTEESKTWVFHGFRRAAEKILDEANTAVVRGRARTFLRQLDRWEEIQSEYAKVSSVLDETDRSNQKLKSYSRLKTTSPSTQTDSTKASESDDSTSTNEDRYDGVGTLRPVLSQKVGSPRYALLDRSGAIKYYVTPAPGVSMRRYIGKQVGVTGAIGIVPELKKQHVVANRIQIIGSSLR